MTKESCLDTPLRHRYITTSSIQDNALPGCRTERSLVNPWKTSAWWKRIFMASCSEFYPRSNHIRDLSSILFLPPEPGQSRLPQGFTATLEASSASLGSAKVMVRLESCE